MLVLLAGKSLKKLTITVSKRQNAGTKGANCRIAGNKSRTGTRHSSAKTENTPPLMLVLHV